MYSTNNERKSVVAERFIRNLKNKILKHMTSISKVSILKQQRISKSTKMKPVDVTPSTYIDFKKIKKYRKS